MATCILRSVGVITSQEHMSRVMFGPSVRSRCRCLSQRVGDLSTLQNSRVSVEFAPILIYIPNTEKVNPSLPEYHANDALGQTTDHCDLVLRVL